MRLSPVDAATVCSTTPARALGLQGFGVIAPGRHRRSGRSRSGFTRSGRPGSGGYWPLVRLNLVSIRMSANFALSDVERNGPRPARLSVHEVHRPRPARSWPPLPSGSACVVSVDSQGQIVREEKRFTVTGTPELQAHDLRRLDRDSVLGQARRRDRDREARRDARSGRRARNQEHAGRQSHRARGEAAAARESFTRFRVPSGRPARG